MTKLVIVALAALMALGTAWAGDSAKHDMMAEMMNCSVCKNMAVHMGELGPVMKTEIVEMDNGMAMVHRINDESKLATFRSASSAMSEAGAACVNYSDAEAQDNLCGFCQGMRGLLVAGASMSKGDTADGCLTVISSDDPEVQTRIAAFHKMAAEVMGSS